MEAQEEGYEEVVGTGGDKGAEVRREENKGVVGDQVVLFGEEREVKQAE